MKIAISVVADNKETDVDQRFGRAKFFAIVETDSGKIEFVNNEQNLNAAQGAGIQSAQNVINAGAKAILTGHCGPKAFATLQAAKVKIYIDVNGKLEDAIKAFTNNTLKETDSPDVEGHW